MKSRHWKIRGERSKAEAEAEATCDSFIVVPKPFHFLQICKLNVVRKQTDKQKTLLNFVISKRSKSCVSLCFGMFTLRLWTLISFPCPALLRYYEYSLRCNKVFNGNATQSCHSQYFNGVFFILQRDESNRSSYFIWILFINQCRSVHLPACDNPIIITSNESTPLYSLWME